MNHQKAIGGGNAHQIPGALPADGLYNWIVVLHPDARRQEHGQARSLAEGLCQASAEKDRRLKGCSA
jgi:hypothetical protein